MALSPINISQVSKGRRFLNSFAGKTLLPLLMTEACVEAGRTYQAYKRGGFTEARERITEEFMGAVFWFASIPLVNKLIDATIGKKVLKLPKESCEVGKDAARSSMHNFVEAHPERFKNIEEGKNLLAKYRIGKIATAILLANAFMGFVLPKVNQSITRHLRKNQEQQGNTQQVKMPQNDNTQKLQSENNKNSSNQPIFTMSQFIQQSSQNKSNPSFGNISALGIVNFLENTPKAQLITEDVGVATGRSICARNKYERREILFRDICSMFFYMFGIPVINKALNGIEIGAASRLDAVSAKATENHLVDMLGENGKMSIDAFKKAVFGNKEALNDINLKEILTEDGNAPLETVLEKFQQIDRERASRMSKLQPLREGKEILTEAQIKDLLTGGKINSPEFMDDLYKIFSTKDPLFKPKGATYQDKFGYVSEKGFLGKKQEVKKFIEDIIKKAEKSGSEVTSEMIKKASKSNAKFNAINLATGFVISALFLSTLIPKMQYWLTKKATGSSEFPGVTEYDKKDTQKV